MLDSKLLGVAQTAVQSVRKILRVPKLVMESDQRDIVSQTPCVRLVHEHVSDVSNVSSYTAKQNVLELWSLVLFCVCFPACSWERSSAQRRRAS